jgi:spermidine synthase
MVRQFVRQWPSRVDVMLVDAFNSEGMPPRLGSQRFYDDCAGSLQPDGVLVVNLHAGHRHFDAYVAASSAASTTRCWWWKTVI